MKNKTRFKYSKKIFSNTLTYKVSMTLNLAITAFCIILITLYIIGNYQGFQDENQQWILSILSYIAIFNSLFSIVLTIETGIKIFTEKQKVKNIINMIALILSALFCIFCTGTSNIISYISGGIK
jgi:preprotein translocase subunit SecG